MTSLCATDGQAYHSPPVGTQCDNDCAHALPEPNTTGKDLPYFHNVGIADSTFCWTDNENRHVRTWTNRVLSYFGPSHGHVLS
jgi:hypothetical protein